MAEKPLTTSWMWKQDEEIWGLTLNVDEQKIEWFDGVGCACGDSFAEQTIPDFLKKGARYGDPPDDILAELRESLTALGHTSH